MHFFEWSEAEGVIGGCDENDVYFGLCFWFLQAPPSKYIFEIWNLKFQIKIAHFSNFREMKLEVWRTQLIHILQVYVLHIFFFEAYSIIFPPNNKLWALFCVLRAHLICTCFGRWLRLRPRRRDLTENLWQVNNLRVNLIIQRTKIGKLKSSVVEIFWVQKFEPYYLLYQVNYTKNLA